MRRLVSFWDFSPLFDHCGLKIIEAFHNSEYCMMMHPGWGLTAEWKEDKSQIILYCSDFQNCHCNKKNQSWRNYLFWKSNSRRSEIKCWGPDWGWDQNMSRLLRKNQQNSIQVRLYKGCVNFQLLLSFCSGRCGSCGVPICSEKCADQSAHLLECDLINEDFQEYGILTPLRFLASKSKFPEDYRKMNGLVGHLEMKKSGPDWKNISTMADKIEKFNIPEVSRQDIEEAICILDSNSYQLLHQEQSKFLNGVFIVASMFNHVCYQANSRPSFGKNYAMKVIATGKNS